MKSESRDPRDKVTAILLIPFFNLFFDIGGRHGHKTILNYGKYQNWKKVGLDPKKVELYQYVFSNGTSEELCFLMAVFMLDGLLPGVKIRPSWLNGNVPVSKGYQDMLVDFNGAKNAGLLQPGEGTKFFQQTGGTLKHLVTNLQFNSTCTVLVSIFYDMFLRKPTEKAVKWQLKVMGIKPFHASPARLEALRKDFLDDLALKDEGNFFSI